MSPLPVLAAAAVVAGVAGIAYLVYRRRDLGTSADRATFDTLHTASLASLGLREGLTRPGSERAVKHLRALLGTTAVALTDSSRVLAVDGGSHHHADAAVTHARHALRDARTVIVAAREVSCGAPDCPARVAVAAPLVDRGTVVGALVAYSRDSSAMLVRAVEEVARWVSGQLELAGADQQRTQLMEAELRALRAQISPHFVYNSLNAVASFMRTDAERARELLLEFADFTRYALRRGGEFATLADELRNTERYLVLEQARFGERLRVSLRVAPEVLPIAVPFLVVQPLVENAVRHGLEGAAEVVTVSIAAVDAGQDALITVEDDGAGSDPGVIRAALEGIDAGAGARGGSVGLGNVDARLRQVYGDPYGLVIETAPTAGTKVSFRVPKFSPGVRADPAPRG
ncbi:histidine kinase [Jatrophihabitans cynanchi]|uniref:Histidine kinase n=1 Tax=Jatrophihabitans cynanchi TaxID=2944128 RepID=A0ABY7JWL0_9ACTN|nr:histidine kinase [Jatrophihabitans sp. SB3-54]WAX56952.1 histidine kinase [Jatrophihabitans sp. SB3-54]